MNLFVHYYYLPTLNDKTSSFYYKMKIYSTKEIELIPNIMINTKQYMENEMK